MKDFYPNDPSYYLKNELVQRMKRRPYYSLRAFARDLEVSPSTLSEVLRGRSKLSEQRIKLIGEKIKLPAEHQKHWCDLIEAKYSRSSLKKKNADLNIQMRLKKSKKHIDLASYETISSWESFAILELLNFNNPLTMEQIAKKLGLTTSELDRLIQNLNKLNLIFWKDDRWQAAEEETFVGENVKSDALRRYHRGILNKAMKSIDTQTLEQRELRSIVFSLNRKDLPKLKSDLNEMWIELLSRYAYSEDKDSVYCFSMQLFDLLDEG